MTDVVVQVSAPDDENGNISKEPGTGSANKPSSLPLPFLRVEQLREEGCTSPGSSTYNSDDSEFSDATDAVTRFGEFVPPSPELAKEIVTQLEFYFADENILKDSFLLKHARRNKEGYVNLKLITSFKKMKTLTKDYRQVAYALRQGAVNLIVNEEGNKVKRKTPLPDYDETKVSRTVVAINLPSESPNTETVSSLFNQCGEITMMQILKPGKAIPTDIKKHLLKHPEIGNVVCAVIEFEKHENALRAVAMSAEGEDWEKGLRVVMLAVSKPKQAEDSESESEFKQKKPNKKKALRSKVLEREHDGLSSGSEGDFLMPRPKPRSRQNSFDSNSSNGSRGGYQRNLSPSAAEKNWRSSGEPALNQRRRSMPLPQSPLADSPAKSSPKASPIASPHTSPCASPEMRRRANSGGARSSPDGSPSSSPWVQRRMQAAANREMSPLAKGLSGSRGRLDNIMRTPRGPEAGKGFYCGKGRGQPCATECS